MGTLWAYLRQIGNQQAVIRLMAAQEIHARFVGTFAGLTWSFLSPLVMILVYWFVFSVGFRVQPVGDMPFVLMYVCGMMPFLLFSETLSTSTEAIVRNKHLVKKTVFPTEILPAVQFLAGLVGHAIMLAIVAGLMAYYGVGLSLYTAQVFYYLLALAALSLGLSWLLASVNVYCRDLEHVLKVILNVWFWATPIVWPLDIMPEAYRPLLKLNPLYYVVAGYRDSLLYQVPLWRDGYAGLYYWAVCLGLLAAGGVVFRKLKPGFADVL